VLAARQEEMPLQQAAALCQHIKNHPVFHVISPVNLLSLSTLSFCANAKNDGGK
jgi:hypothetical protein